jgi:putative DNA primase/helicase
MPPRIGEPELEQEGRLLVQRLGGRWGAGGGMCRCPAHDDRRPSLSVRLGRTRLLLHCFAGCAASDVLRAIRSAGLIESRSAPREENGLPARARAGSAGTAARLWNGGRAIAGTPAERYLASRAIATVTPELRYHPRMPHGPRPSTRFRPALVAAVRDASGLVAVHRTFIDSRRARLAGLPEPRCALGALRGGAVRLGGVASRIGLAEGIETALSALALFGLPCWATLGTERFRLVALPAQVKELLLFLDNDAGGRRAEALARQAYADLPIIAHYPRRPGADWNDVLVARGGAVAAP